MKVLTSCNASKTLSPSNMETFECHSEGDLKKFPFFAPHYNDDGICHLIESNKKRRKVLSWPFQLRRGSTLTSESSDTLDVDLKTSLFDQPLAIVCEDDSLPKPIMDILTILCLKGPFVEGIFRKNANEKSRKELKEELNSGASVDLDSKPLHLLAVVFKDFLRSIPNMLLSSDLYHEWMAALEKQDICERIEDIKQVADKLPRPNLVLLKHLMCVLHHISQHSGTNKMDASNLAICIGPNLLNPQQKRDQPLEIQKQLNDRVKVLVEFFIENSFEIFGGDLSLLISTSAEDSLEHTGSTDLSFCQQNDSAYDSTDLEVEGLCSLSPNRQQSIQCRCGNSGIGGQMCQMDVHSGLSASSGRDPENCSGKMDRRSSEPNLFISQAGPEQGISKQKLTKSHDDVTVGQSSVDCEVEDQLHGHKEDNFMTCNYKNKKPACLKVNTSLQLELSLSKTPSSCSLDSSCSNSDSSVFTSSPRISPSSPKRRFFPRHESFSTNKCMEGNKVLPIKRQIKKHSMSFSFLQYKKTLTKTQSWEPERQIAATNRNSFKKDFESGAQRNCDIVQERCDALLEPDHPYQPRARLMSADEVFRLVDQKNPGKPPSYEEAIQRSISAKLPSYGSLTVHSLRSTMLHHDSLLPHSLHKDNFNHNVHDGDASSEHVKPCMHNRVHRRCPISDAAEEMHTHVHVNATSAHRSRTRPELQEQTKQECLLRRCSHPLFEGYDQIQYAKESYV